jgi:hypothetical protein
VSLTKTEMAEVLEQVKIFFPRFEISEEVVLGWWRLFERESFLCVRDAMAEVLKTSTYAPKPADLSFALGRSMKPAPTLFGGKEEYLARVRYYWEAMKRDHERGTITVYRRHPKGFSTTTRRKTNEVAVGMWSFEGEMLPRFMEPQNPDIEEDLGHGQVWRFGPRRYGLALVEKAS